MKFFPRSSLPARTFWLVCFEAALVFLAVWAGVWLRVGEETELLFWVENGWAKTLFVALVCQICLYYADLYDFRTVSERRELFVRLMQALGATSLILAFAYFWFPALMLGRGVFVLSAGILLIVIAGWRIAFEWLTRALGPRERLLLVGTERGAIALAQELHAQRHTLGVEIVGFVDPDPAKVGAPVINPGVIGTIADIPAIVRSHRVDRVVVSLGDARGKLPVDRLLEMKLKDGVGFDHLASVYEEYTGKIAVENLRPSWFIFSDGFRKSGALLTAKRLLDLVVAGIGLVLAAPLMLIVALLVRVSSRGPVLYHQDRVGQNGRVFIVHKFRSMVTDAEKATGAVWAQKNDKRITPIGGFLRRSRLDELPQLFNILRCDMSLIGPRPERPEFVQALTERIPFYGQRHVVRPGLSGWAQIRYTYGASVEDAMEKLQYDLFYIKHMSLSLDLFIMFSTIKTVLQRRGA
jgi:sugar transferase (PEP-CTERM system associated)